METLFKLNVRVTKEHIEKAMYCGYTEDSISNIGGHCAVAVAVKEIFPKAYVTNSCIPPFFYKKGGIGCNINHNAEDFIKQFDRNLPMQRIEMDECDVEIDITQEVLDVLNKDVNWESIVNSSSHMKLVKI